MGGGDTWHRSAAPHLPRGEGPVSRRSGRGSRPLRNGSRQPPEGGGRAPPRRLPRCWQTKHSRRLPPSPLPPPVPRSWELCPPAGLGSPALCWSRWAPDPLRGPAAGAPCPCERVAPWWEGWKVTRRKRCAGILPVERGLSWFPSPLLWAGLSQLLFVEFCIYLCSKRYHSVDILIGSSLSGRRNSGLEP